MKHKTIPVQAYTYLYYDTETGKYFARATLDGTGKMVELAEVE